MVISRAFKNARLLKSLTGLTEQEFNQLLIRFEQACLAMQASQKRKRALGAGRKGSLPDQKSRLFLILFYLKVYPTFDLASMFFDVDRSRPCRWVQA